MLILTRKTNEAIMIGDDIVVRVLEVNGHQVRIGIQAPPEITIDREEIRAKRGTDEWEDRRAK